MNFQNRYMFNHESSMPDPRQMTSSMFMAEPDLGHWKPEGANPYRKQSSDHMKPTKLGSKGGMQKQFKATKSIGNKT